MFIKTCSRAYSGFQPDLEQKNMVKYQIAFQLRPLTELTNRDETLND